MSLVCGFTKSPFDAVGTAVIFAHPYVTRMYSHIICISLECTRMSPVFHSYVLVCHPYLTRLWFYHEPLELVLLQFVEFWNLANVIKLNNNILIIY